MPIKVTIGDIAKAANVSLSTVSLVLNEKPGISKETRGLVLDAARKLGYQLPLRSGGRRHSLLSTIGLVVKTEPGLLPPSNPFYSQIIAGVDDACQEMGVNLLFSMLPVDENNYPLNVPPLLENTSLDGLLMVGAFIDATIESLAGQHAPPVVLVDGYSDTESFDMVVGDNFRAAYQAVEYLIHLGHCHIGLVGTQPGAYPSLNERRNGYLRALKENDLGTPLIATFNVNRTQGEAETTQLLREHPELTALFCANDNVALGALRAAHRVGRRVPDDLSIVGFDDTYLATSIAPALTTVHVDTLTMGRAAVHLLALRLEQPAAARFTWLTHPRLVVRQSSAAPPSR